MMQAIKGAMLPPLTFKRVSFLLGKGAGGIGPIAPPNPLNLLTADR